MKEKIFYTDGACSGKPGEGGWAFVELVKSSCGYETKITSGGKKQTTNNEMELTAVYMALVKSFKANIKQVTIYSDSAYVVNAITKGWLLNWHNNGWKTKENKPVKNKHIWEKVHKLICEKGMKINFVWIKGHNKDPLNELADKAAVDAKQMYMGE